MENEYENNLPEGNMENDDLVSDESAIFSDEAEVSSSEEINIDEDNLTDGDYTAIEYDVLSEENNTEEEDSDDNKKHIIKNKLLREIVSWATTILAAVFIAIIINTYFFRISRVSGDSMLQTYHNEDVVYITRLPYIFGDVERNDIVIFDSTLKPRNFFTEVEESLKYNVISYKLFNVAQPTNYYIKRVIAVEGDTIQIKEDGVYVNGELLNEPYVNPAEVPSYTNVAERLKNGVTVPEGKVFVLGDNRNHSTDSRMIGFVPVEDIIGKVIGT